MENAEDIFHVLEEFSKRKPKTIPQELNDYLGYVARTGDPVFQWSLVKSLFKEKLLNVITDFYETSPGVDIPPYPNVDPFNYDIMKNSLLERLDSFTSAPFTVQRISELLTCPRKQYNRIDKFMRAIEKNILVVSTREPGQQRHTEPENGEPVVNGSDNNSEYNVDVEMEDMSWKENREQKLAEPQPSSSDAHNITVDDLEVRLQAKQDTPMESEPKVAAQYESVTPPELNVSMEDQTIPENKDNNKADFEPKPSPSCEVAINSKDNDKIEKLEEAEALTPKPEEVKNELVPIPQIVIDDAEMTEQKLREQSDTIEKQSDTQTSENSDSDTAVVEDKEVADCQQSSIDESSSDSNSKDELEPKIMSEVSTSSEESSSSSDNVDGNSNSPKCDKPIDIHEESNHSIINPENIDKPALEVNNPQKAHVTEEETSKVSIQSDNYSISDVSSVLPQPTTECQKTETVALLETPTESADSVTEPDKQEEEKTEPTVKNEETAES